MLILGMAALGVASDGGNDDPRPGVESEQGQGKMGKLQDAEEIWQLENIFKDVFSER